MIDKIWLTVGVIYFIGCILLDALIKMNFVKRIKDGTFKFNSIYAYCFCGTALAILTALSVLITMKYIGYTDSETTYIERNLVWLIILITNIMNIKIYYNLTKMFLKSDTQKDVVNK